MGEGQKIMEIAIVKSFEMAALSLLFFATGFVVAEVAKAGEVGSPQFARFPAPVLAGTHVPDGYRINEQGAWLDGLGKRVADPAVNFAGRYHLGLHSCGAGCRYYTLVDLSSGTDLSSVVEMFASTDPPSRTADGMIYVTDLLSRPSSRLLVAQYILDTPSGAACRERLFLLEEEKLRAISGTRRSCGAW